jgi:hypothetical protein
MSARVPRRNAAVRDHDRVYVNNTGKTVVIMSVVRSAAGLERVGQSGQQCDDARRAVDYQVGVFLQAGRLG